MWVVAEIPEKFYMLRCKTTGSFWRSYGGRIYWTRKSHILRSIEFDSDLHEIIEVKVEKAK